MGRLLSIQPQKVVVVERKPASPIISHDGYSFVIRSMP